MGLNISIDDFKSIGRLACLSTIFSTIQFLLLTSLAALLYPGGYDYLGYYFSDLGAVVARNGASNSFSSTMFFITLTLTGLAIIPLWLILPSLFKESTVERLLSILGSIIGLIAVPLLIAIGMFPMDTQSELHGFFARYMFLSFGIAILIYSIAIVVNQNYSNFYSLIGLAIFILVIIYVFFELGDLHTFVQKVIVYSYIVWAFIQVFRIWPSVKPEKIAPV
ncbi:MAG: hypothetical protein ACW964_15845 [Candidatus Hodarchaeales archaeon]|jgi:hypothetical membrane protein